MNGSAQARAAPVNKDKINATLESWETNLDGCALDIGTETLYICLTPHYIATGAAAWVL